MELVDSRSHLSFELFVLFFEIIRFFTFWFLFFRWLFRKSTCFHIIRGWLNIKFWLLFLEVSIFFYCYCNVFIWFDLLLMLNFLFLWAYSFGNWLVKDLFTPLPHHMVNGGLTVPMLFLEVLPNSVFLPLLFFFLRLVIGKVLLIKLLLLLFNFFLFPFFFFVELLFPFEALNLLQFLLFLFIGLLFPLVLLLLEGLLHVVFFQIQGLSLGSFGLVYVLYVRWDSTGFLIIISLEIWCGVREKIVEVLLELFIGVGFRNLLRLNVPLFRLGLAFLRIDYRVQQVIFLGPSKVSPIPPQVEVQFAY